MFLASWRELVYWTCATRLFTGPGPGRLAYMGPEPPHEPLFPLSCYCIVSLQVAASSLVTMLERGCIQALAERIREKICENPGLDGHAGRGEEKLVMYDGIRNQSCKQADLRLFEISSV